MAQLLVIIILVAVYMFFKNKTAMFKPKDLKYLVFIEVGVYLLLFNFHLFIFAAIIGGLYFLFKKLK